MDSNKKTPNASPSKLDQIQKANTNSTLDNSTKNIAAADRLMDSPSKAGNHFDSNDNQHDM